MMAIDKTSLDQWYPIDTEALIPYGTSANRLLGIDLAVIRTQDGDVTVKAQENNLPIRRRYGYIWTTLGTPDKEIFPIEEADEPDRRMVPCGAVTVKASGLRIVENFLDMAHFPFVHTDILGSEPHTEVEHYNVEIRRDVDEVWATNCQFFQPQAALSATDGLMTHYIYRVMTPFTTLLYKTCPNSDSRWDVICLFVQPLDPDRCRAHPIMYLIDDQSTTASLIQFQQLIFLQDRIILENQRPVLLPMEPRSEIPTRADATSIAYRRWLKEKGVTYGTSLKAVA
ncbi:MULTISPECIES: aromatic ring-hydroxylating oxygenase subunit alpha [Rhizobium/Agrobacterium group]|uniref:Vanillate O-demethylase oxygenase subunit n=2 Tax=Rhizobium/Agrobacterium group TaxID=227290 RepID=B9K0Z6_ALLAM|nr:MULTISPECIES: aromatic ring-hydroxylating dioxygenase subunit alpha [Rhizobium/Agrobacterium group]ACM38544.1 vanillate O-demethylase oxygenase subunit [Allorhizobium ampelinum S4]MUO26758.1 aromatic ring-hydroxylating dioxygenase subunit alpha [Agrobacterium vitis]MUO41871.1 aromatic ring-hydroxylating dioxygenase subunit alpha [Agrobacterium vitis]MUP10371.1 aromatic ring-hydroxylating dioxygenase subunit alpha [Agrobacterium vitis]